MVERCASRLRGIILLPRKAGMLIRYSDQVEAKRKLKLPHISCWDFDLYDPLEKLFFKICDRRVRVRFIKIWFWDLFPPSRQLSLFSAPSRDEEKKKVVIKALDQIRNRYGEDAIKHGREIIQHFRGREAI